MCLQSMAFVKDKIITAKSFLLQLLILPDEGTYVMNCVKSNQLTK
jgi:hypothetical protein